MVNIKESDDNLGYSIELVEKAQSDLNLLTAKSKKLLRALSREEPQLLEVLSTIVYCSKNFYEGQDLVFKLHELKPKLKKHYNDAFELAEKHFNIKL